MPFASHAPGVHVGIDFVDAFFFVGIAFLLDYPINNMPSESHAPGVHVGIDSVDAFFFVGIACLLDYPINNMPSASRGQKSRA